VLKLNIDNTTWKKEPQEFHKYEMGVKCEMENAIPPYLSVAILCRPEGTSPLEAIFALDKKIGKKDWELIKTAMGLPSNCQPPHKGDPIFMPLPVGPRTRARKK
jgi:hypothetical protein